MADVKVEFTNEEARHIEKLLDNEASRVHNKIEKMIMDGQFRAKHAAEEYEEPGYVDMFHRLMDEYMRAEMILKTLRNKFEDVLDE